MGMLSAGFAPSETPQRTGWASDDDLHHIYCECTGSNVALCGRDLTDVPEVIVDDDNLCVVCAELEVIPCECTP